MKRFFQFMMERTWRLSAVLFFTLIIRVSCYGQSCDSLHCGCDNNDLQPSGIMIGHTHPKGTWMFSYRLMSMRMRGNLQGTQSISDDAIYQNYLMSPQNMTMNMHMLMAMYGISSRLSVMAMFQYNTLTMNMSMPPGGMHMHGMTMPDMNTASMHMNTSGIGDTRLYATYALLNASRHRLMLSAGINLPTGSIGITGDENSMLPGQRLPYMMQLGSGTFDLLPGITYVLSSDKLAWGTQLTGIVRPGYNRLNYAWGNELCATTWLAWQLLPWLSASARAETTYAAGIRGNDADLFEIMEPDSKADNYGGTKLNAYLGINVYLKKIAHSKLSFEYGVPLYQNLNGIQPATRGMLYAGWAVAF